MDTNAIKTLRPYQCRCIDLLRLSYGTGHRSPILQLPTGGGKTVVFTDITAGARAKGRRVLIVAHRRELVRQAGAKLEAIGVPYGIIAAGIGSMPDELVQVASVQTIVRRLGKMPQFDLIVLDEAHHARAAQWRELIAAQPQAKLLGVTATPARLDGKGLGIAHGGMFDDLICGPSIAELVRDGFLSPARCYVPEQKLDLRGVHVRGGDYAPGDLDRIMQDGVITGDAIANYRMRADHQAAIAFCISIEHAEAVAQSFREAGYRAQCVHGSTRKDERDAAIAGLGNGSVEVLTSCDLISEGLDVPAIGAVILLRPTKSLVLYMQQVGRGMRPAAGKAALAVLDHVGNVLEHGLPDAGRTWSLDGVEKRRNPRHCASDAPVWRCECGCANPLGLNVCDACGEPKPGREITVTPGTLAELTAERLARARQLTFREMARTRLSEAELREFARARGYRPGWVFHRLREQAVGGVA